MAKATLLVLDSFGIGASADASKFNDVGADTLGHIAERCASERANQGRSGPLKLPNLTRLGLMHAAKQSRGTYPDGCATDMTPSGAYGHARELSSGKDTSSGHWEIAGVPVLFDWHYFTDRERSFSDDILRPWIERCSLQGVLGNCHSSGTVILDKLGEEHMRTGKPIVYTSADSVFQIAAHEQTFGLERLLDISRVARELLDPYNVGRVIARPFIGDKAGAFERTGNRRDFSVPPPAPTLLDHLTDNGGEVISIGKIADIYAQRGITKKVKATGLEALVDATKLAMREANDQSLVFTNFVDFDSAYGHRRDVDGYARALEYFDARLPELIDTMADDDVMILTADHGCDPTWPGSDHTREHIPVLCCGPQVKAGSLGERETFADIGQSLATHFKLEPLDYGKSFL
ncbi:MAG: phosphopentomutase [Gammaproteobacteria bacterium]